jgi:CheY-like chemotaxis protein
VAKILVADDNSNVQKTMALALADLGVEVISVNNGEAAVRKLADISPDLVLADIFMPVRNGYEVCEYVKKDARFAHVPVILLVGAFDPLDEREAQRVGADGILKKPFVPPEPLITMVKTLLDRSIGERMVAVPVAKVPETMQAKARRRTIAEAPAPSPPMPEESSPDEFKVPAGRVSFGEGDRPVAFGQLLETSGGPTSKSETDVVEPVDDEQILTSSRDSTLGEPVFWRNDTPEMEPEAEPSADTQDELSVHKWGLEEDPRSRREAAATPRPVEPLEFVPEDQEDASPSHVDSESIVLDQAAQSDLTVESGKAPELAANPLEWLATAPAQHSDAAPETDLAWGEPNSDGLAFRTRGKQVEPGPFPDAFKPIDAQEPSAHSEAAADPNKRNANAATVKISPQLSRASTSRSDPQPPEDTARSVPVHKWAEMTDNFDEPATETSAPHAASISAPLTQGPAAKQTISQPDAAKPLQTSKSAESAAQGAPPSSPAPVAPDPALVEAVVQRVLDKMRPQVVDIITKEFLRPVVQALVQREIKKN